jgi:hypothetical protein
MTIQESSIDIIGFTRTFPLIMLAMSNFMTNPPTNDEMAKANKLVQAFAMQISREKCRL